MQLDLNSKIKSSAMSLMLTAGFCMAIALLLALLGLSSSLWSTSIVSLCIGLSIHLTFIIFGDTAGRILPPYLAPIPQTAVGLLLGLMAAGIFTRGLPGYFFADSYTTLILGIFFGALGFVLNVTRTRLLSAQADLGQAEAKRQAQEKLLLETELKLLQAQIEPHFLFNTLSNVVGLIRTEPAAAERTLINLTTLLRSSLKRTRAQSVTLEEEFSIVKAYLEIQAIRMQGRLTYDFLPKDWQEDEILCQWPLPPLLVQPLVENAIKHGIDRSETGGKVAVTAHCENNRLHIRVADTGVGIKTDKAIAGKHSGTGTGLSNVRNRLTMLYDGEALMTITDNLPSGVVVTLVIPRAL